MQHRVAWGTSVYQELLSLSLPPSPPPHTHTHTHTHTLSSPPLFPPLFPPPLFFSQPHPLSVPLSHHHFRFSFHLLSLSLLLLSLFLPPHPSSCCLCLSLCLCLCLSLSVALPISQHWKLEGEQSFSIKVWKFSKALMSWDRREDKKCFKRQVWGHGVPVFLMLWNCVSACVWLLLLFLALFGMHLHLCVAAVTKRINLCALQGYSYLECCLPIHGTKITIVIEIVASVSPFRGSYDPFQGDPKWRHQLP